MEEKLNNNNEPRRRIFSKALLSGAAIITIGPGFARAATSCTGVGPQGGSLGSSDQACVRPGYNDTCQGNSINDPIFVEILEVKDDEGNVTGYKCPGDAYVVSNSAWSSLTGSNFSNKDFF